ncbi:hypothetical protein ACFPT7_16490 [Acidicapsa dinghuensis]|uniref:Uncharacterized protein n=1 Tax=Acidicapsa dinghuensis TaxID=2218256 RepID=A0ABW1EIY2_9BACT|nr:hypothetical protein [Acidicapsa dinghuensis]
MKTSYLAVVLCFASGSLMALERLPKVPTTGTVNVLLANSNGITIVTDSRASGPNGEIVNDKSQKLFQLDAQTVCSIAGFGADPGPYRKLGESAAGVIVAFSEGLANPPKHLSFRQKVSALTWELAERLAGLESEWQYAQHSRPPRNDTLVMLFAGFDLDGTPTVAKIEVSVIPEPVSGAKFQFHGKVTKIEYERVGRRLITYTSGVDEAAKERLKHPEAFKEEKGLQAYEQALRTGKTADMTIEGLETLARSLEFVVAGRTPVVGGPAQLASLHDNKVTVTLPDDLIRFPPPFTNGILVGSGASGSPLSLAIYTEPHTVFVDFHCDHSAFRLDDMMLIGGVYEGCNFFFNGGEFYRDPSVIVRGGRLIIGPRVDTSNYYYRKAHESMPELEVVSYKQLPNADTVTNRMFNYLPQ